MFYLHATPLRLGAAADFLPGPLPYTPPASPLPFPATTSVLPSFFLVPLGGAWTDDYGGRQMLADRAWGTVEAPAGYKARQVSTFGDQS